MAVMTGTQRRRLRRMCPVAEMSRLDNRLKYLDSDGSYNGPVNVDIANLSSENAMTVGALADTAGSGIELSSTVVGALRAFADDGNANIGDSVRNILARTLLDATQTGGTIRSIQGQLKLVDGVGLGTGVYTANQGYIELMGDHTIASAGKVSCFDASLEIASGKALTVASGAFVAGLKVETTGAGTISNSGTCAGVLIDKATGAASWPVGLFIDTGKARTPIKIGTWVSNTASTGHVLAYLTEDSGSYASAAIAVHCDDGGAAVTNITTPIFSRYLLTVDQSGGGTQAAFFAHLKSGGTSTRTYTTGGIRGAYIFTQLAATTLVTNAELVTINAATSLAGTLTVGSGCMFAGVDVNIAGASSVSNSGTAAGVIVRKTSGATATWPVGLYIPTGGTRTPIKIGTWISNTASTGHVLAYLTEDSGSYTSAAIAVHCDDGGAAVTNITTPVFSRYLLTVDQSGGATQTALFAHLKSGGTSTRTYTTGGIRGAYIFTQLAATTLVTSAELVTINAATTLAGTLTVGSGCTFAGVDVNIGGASSVSNSGTAAGVLIRCKDEGAVWPIGLYVKATGAQTPIQVGLWSSATKDIGYVPATGYADTSGCSAGIRVYCDDGGDVGAGILAGIFTRYLLTVAQTGGATQTGLYSQFKSYGTLTLTTGGFRGAYIFNQAGTITLATSAEYVVANMACTLAGTMTVGSGCMFAGVDVNIGGAGTVSNSGTAAGVVIRSKGEGAVWPYGLYIPAGAATYPIYAAATQTSATPGTVRTIHGVATTHSSMTSGNLVGVRGEINMAGACSSTAYLYGVQGKAITGANTFTGTALAGLYGQMDVTGGTISSGHVAAIQANIYGANSGSIPMEGIYIEHAGGAVINSFIQMFGKTDYVFDIASNAHTNVSLTGTPGACTGATGWIKVLVEGSVRYIPLAETVS